MRGRRRGRRSPTQESPDQASEVSSTSTGTGSVTLIQSSPGVESPEQNVTPPLPDPTDSAATPPGGIPQQRNIEETISDVVTAQAELDNVLTPSPPVTQPAVDEPAASPPETERVSDTPVAPEAVAVANHAPPPEQESVVVSSEPEKPIEAISDSESETAVELSPESPEPVASLTEVAASSETFTEDFSAPPPVAPPVAHEELVEEVPAQPVVAAQAASGNPLPRVLAVANQKGGVGKTTTSVNLGAALAELGFRVLVIDLDPQGNATTGLGIDARNFELSMYDVLMRDSSLEDCVEPTSMKNLFVAPATIALAGAEIELVPAFSRELKLKKSIESVIDEFDYVLIDCPPSLGLITVNALAAADEVLVPIQCEYYALEGLSQLMRNVHLVASNLNPKLDISTIVLTMYDARTKLSDQVANEVRLHFGSKVCRSVIPRTVRLSEAPSFGQPITAFDPASRGAIAYRELAKEVSGGNKA
jgi:chromosome partitioning protein